MATGLDGKIMTYDGENRPLSVRLAGKMTCYVYGADGTRLKKIENLAPAANCPAAPTASNPVTAYFANVEIRNFGKSPIDVLFNSPVGFTGIDRLLTSAARFTVDLVRSSAYMPSASPVKW